MRRKFKNWLIVILFRLLDVPDSKVDDKHIEQWLADTWKDQRFIKYFRRRHEAISRELSGGMGMVEVKRDDYIRYSGQRFELSRLASEAKRAYNKKKK